MRNVKFKQLLKKSKKKKNTIKKEPKLLKVKISEKEN